MSDKKSAVEYMVHLDGIRAFAVCGVILEHWASGFPGALRAMVGSIDLGGLGVECFFVLSGFLITLILLDTKDRNLPFRKALGHFYTRRVLRIFPAYYATLLLGLWIFPPMREVFNWHALYLSNLYPLWHDTFAPIGGHFWSLSVEEQFYLFWPLIVLLLPVRNIMQLALALCVLAPLTRLGLWYAMGGIHLSMWTFPTTALDLLCFGAFLACIKYQFDLPADGMFLRRLNIIGLLALLAYGFVYSQFHETLLFGVLGRTLSALFFGALIVNAANGFNGPAKWLLGNKPIIWLGTISYGLYIFHPFIPKAYLLLLGVFGLGQDVFGAYYIRFPLMALTLLLVTSASFYLMERPIRGFRKYFA